MYWATPQGVLVYFRVLKSPYLRIGTQITNLSPVIVKNKTFWTPAAHVKVTFSLFLERISKQYESFECFLPDVGYYLQLIKVTALYSIKSQN